MDSSDFPSFLIIVAGIFVVLLILLGPSLFSSFRNWSIRKGWKD